MKHQSKHNTAKLSSNQRIGNHFEDKQTERQQAIENSKLFDILPHLKDKPITYLLKR